QSGSGAQHQAVSGLAAVKGAAGFPVIAPATVAGRTLESIHLVGSGDKETVIAVYGDNLGAIAVVERKAGGHRAGPLGALPSVTVNGHAVHELATPLATVDQWESAGVAYVVAGSVTPAVAHSAAADLG